MEFAAILYNVNLKPIINIQSHIYIKKWCISLSLKMFKLGYLKSVVLFLHNHNYH